jgi:hypothetical protein
LAVSFLTRAPLQHDRTQACRVARPRLAAVESVIKEHRAKLVIIEPLAAFVAGPDANKDQEIRRLLYKPIKIAARRTLAPGFTVCYSCFGGERRLVT